jgi:Fe-S oxidoreductase
MARSGKFKLKPLQKSATFHDPCQVSRRGGAMQVPRDTLAALGMDLHEMSSDPGMNWCCGGGGGVVTLSRATEMRHRVFQIKMRQVEATGAEVLVSSCANCRLSFDDGQAHYKWDKKVHSLLEMVADQLVDQ